MDKFRQFQYPTIIEAVDGLTRLAYFSTGRKDPDFPIWRSGNRLHISDLSVGVESLLSEPFPLGYSYRNTAPRWKTFCTKYVPPEENLLSWFDLCQGTYSPGMEFSLKFAPGADHSCLSLVSFRSKLQPTLTLVSRAVKLFPMGVLDLTLMHLLATELSKTWGDIALRWHILSFQFDPSISLPYLRAKGYTERPSRNSRVVNDKALSWGVKWKSIRHALEVAEKVEANGIDPYRPEGVWLTAKKFLPLPLGGPALEE